MIDASLDKVKRFEIASYRPLYIGALVLRNPQIIGLIGQNLLEEEQTALLDRLATWLIPRAFPAGYPGTGCPHPAGVLLIFMATCPARAFREPQYPT